MRKKRVAASTDGAVSGCARKAENRASEQLRDAQKALPGTEGGYQSRRPTLDTS